MFGLRSSGGGWDEQAASATNEARAITRGNESDHELRDAIALCRLYGTRQTCTQEQ